MTSHNDCAYEHYLQISPQVSQALAKGKPVVALESTIIAHGMPYPTNIETAMAVEEIVRKQGAIPATIGVMAGKIMIGMSKEQLKVMANSKYIFKATTRDIPALLASKRYGATTVAATMFCAHLAGIKVFATGGIGGVHRGAEQSLDISADLIELTRTPVHVISAGAKAILDIAQTLEYLETHEVPVVGYKCEEFPAFFSRESGVKIPWKFDSVDEIAAYLKVKDNLCLPGGTLIANPVPHEHSMSFTQVDAAVRWAHQEAIQQGVSGKEITPFLLAHVAELTGGTSLKTNVAVVRSNAHLAARIAVALRNS